MHSVVYVVYQEKAQLSLVTNWTLQPYYIFEELIKSKVQVAN